MLTMVERSGKRSRSALCSGIPATGTAWSNWATAIRYSGVSHSNWACASASGMLATVGGAYPGRQRALRLHSSTVGERDPTDEAWYDEELARVTATGGRAIFAFSRGPQTPIWVPPEKLRGRLGEVGFANVEELAAGAGVAVLAVRGDPG